MNKFLSWSWEGNTRTLAAAQKHRMSQKKRRLGSGQSSELVLELCNFCNPRRNGLGSCVSDNTAVAEDALGGRHASSSWGAQGYLGKEYKQQKSHALSPKDAIWKWPIDLVIKVSLLAFKNGAKQMPSLGENGWQESKGFGICF